MKRKRMKRLCTGLLSALIAASAVLTTLAASYPGDFNGDGRISAFDAQMLAEAKAGRRELTEEQQARANGLDEHRIINHVLGIEEIEPEEPEAPTEESTGVCETAEEFAANMEMGWNLGCSLSVSSKVTPASFSGLISMQTTDGLYSRSEYLPFDAETGTVELNWRLGNDNGILNTHEGAAVGSVLVEQWNFSLSEADTLIFSVDEFSYTTADGREIVPQDCLGTYQSDMSGGTGAAYLLDAEALGGLLVADIVSIHCRMSIVKLTQGEPTADKIARMETAWGNPVTTQEMINAVRDKGFNMIRIQVSYYNHMDAEGNIDRLWLDRVQEVVDYCMNAGVYCIINTSGINWLTANPEDWKTNKPVYTNLWSQIAERFAGYDDKLLFESCNEVLYIEGNWGEPPLEAYDVMYDIHQTFVDVVRASGGYNATRNLFLNTYGGNYDYGINCNFKLPTDTVEDHLIAQVHVYVPQRFTFNETNLGSTDFVNEWGSEADRRQLDHVLKGVKQRFIDELGVPVLIGEFGVVDRAAEAERVEYISFYSQKAHEYGLELCYFDDGHDFAIFDRKQLTWTQEKLIKALFREDVPDPDPDSAQIDAQTAGWMAVVSCTTGPAGAYNRSDIFRFPSGSRTLQVVWNPGKDNGPISGNMSDTVDRVIIEFWNWDMTGTDYFTYSLDELVYVTASGETVVQGVAGEYKTNMSSGTGDNTIISLKPYGLKLSDIIEIRATVTFIERTSGE